jgi:hypothetical protein
MNNFFDNFSFKSPNTNIPSDVSSDEAVNYIIQKGIVERGITHVGVGIVAGAVASLVLARGGSGARKAITAFGAGVGLGSAWTRTNMDLEDLLKRE